jgi:hypothetical protein
MCFNFGIEVCVLSIGPITLVLINSQISETIKLYPFCSSFEHSVRGDVAAVEVSNQIRFAICSRTVIAVSMLSNIPVSSLLNSLPTDLLSCHTYCIQSCIATDIPDIPDPK